MQPSPAITFAYECRRRRRLLRTNNNNIGKSNQIPAGYPIKIREVIVDNLGNMLDYNQNSNFKTMETFPASLGLSYQKESLQLFHL